MTRVSIERSPLGVRGDGQVWFESLLRATVEFEKKAYGPMSTLERLGLLGADGPSGALFEALNTEALG